MTEKAHPFDRGDVSQENQYVFPYHYIPTIENGHFSQHQYWSWGYHYLGGLEVVRAHLEKEPFESLLDIGCGDGRFLCEVRRHFPEKRLRGIDSSDRAICLARAMNPNLDYECVDICSQEKSREVFDIVTLIEVLEHIPVSEVDGFVSSLSKYLKKGGKLLMTVPHRNKPVQYKHYQHFSGDSLINVLKPYFDIVKLIFFDKKSKILGRLINYALCNRLFVLNNQSLLDMFFSYYLKHLLYCDEANCGRIFVEGRKK